MAILAGSDHAPGHLPESATELHSLSSVYKGAEVKVGDTPLIVFLVDQIEKSSGFEPITIAGPAEVYAPFNLNARIVDTNGSVAVNLKAVLDDHQERFESEPIALLAYDLRLKAGEFDELRALYAEEVSCAVWMPFVRMPENEEELGAFRWKPTYSLSPAEGEAPVRILPGHLAIIRPQAVRLDLLYKLLDLAYRTRNHSVETRKKVMVRSVIGKLIWDDFRALCSLRIPRLTMSVVINGIRIANRLRNGDLSIPELEKAIGGIFLLPDLDSNVSGKGVRHPLVTMISLAEDIDTEEEAADV